MFASHGNQIALAKLVQGYRLSNGDGHGHGHYISTTGEGRKSIKLKVNEIVLQVFFFFIDLMLRSKGSIVS